MKTEDPHDGELDTIVLLQNDNTLTDVQDATTKELYTAMLRKTNKGVLCKAKWEKVFGENIKLIHKVSVVRKRIVPTPACIGCTDVGSILHTFFYCPKTKTFITNVEPIFNKLFGNEFKLNLYRILCGVTYIKLAIMRQK